MSFARVVVPETLDHLAEDDPAAIRSRRDLRRVHRAMGTRGILLRGLRGLSPMRRPGEALRVLELGAGDGSLMLRVARALGPAWGPVELTLLDRQRLVTGATLQAYADAGWQARAQVADVLDWAAAAARDARPREGAAAPWHLVLANLFLHHFEGTRLAALLAGVAACAQSFFACEPRRGRVALAGSHLIGALAVNVVTREDAVLSVRAGFCDRELCAAWPGSARHWRLREYRAGLFSHCFAAERVQAR